MPFASRGSGVRIPSAPPLVTVDAEGELAVGVDAVGADSVAVCQARGAVPRIRLAVWTQLRCASIAVCKPPV